MYNKLTDLQLSNCIDNTYSYNNLLKQSKNKNELFVFYDIDIESISNISQNSSAAKLEINAIQKKYNDLSISNAFYYDSDLFYNSDFQHYNVLIVNVINLN
tara:strand:- start:1 stop:303 length:303 start_codon:yes stop_codon:yes gene_type:complete